MQKATIVNAFTYREGFGQLPVVDIAPGEKKAKYKPLYYANRIFGAGEIVDIILDNSFALYQAPVIVQKKKRKTRR